MMSQIILFRVSAHMYNMHGITHQFYNYGKSPLKGTILMVKNRKKLNQQISGNAVTFPLNHYIINSYLPIYLVTYYIQSYEQVTIFKLQIRF